MKDLRILEALPHTIFVILLSCYLFATTNYNLFKFWQPIIDNFILLVFLIFCLLQSIKLKWSWFTKRVIYSLLIILFLNTYDQLFGLDLYLYLNWYLIPLISLSFTISTTVLFELIYKQYKLWRNGKTNFH